ncbi:FecR family protein [Synechococcus sp. RSCCF101]|uniref:FecR family protein n=1 Tax=Synechococcus sp. RSCCF101 TaxID=2511069 RepID=UPI00177FE224|nr:FecR family protein [Synechococcus sp. RSCCF101]
MHPLPAFAAPKGSVVEVATRPAFVQPPGARESAARAGAGLSDRTRLRTSKPGRMQVRLQDGRSFRMGGDAVLRISGDSLDLRKGQLIAWINPGATRRAPLRVKTRVGTASIQGTTLFIDDRGDEVIFLSWEGEVSLTTNAGEEIELTGGQLTTFRAGNDTWSAPTLLNREQARRRRSNSILLNGFTAPMETMPEVEAVLQRAPAAVAP